MPHAYIRLRVLPGGRYQVRWVDRDQQSRHLHFATRARARAFIAGLAGSRPPQGRRDHGPGALRPRTRQRPVRSIMPGRLDGAAAVRRRGVRLRPASPERVGSLVSPVRVAVVAAQSVVAAGAWS